MLKPRLFRALAVVAVVLAVVVFAVGLWIGRPAQLVQLLRPAPAAEAGLFGEAESGNQPSGTLIGSPQLMIINAPEAFLPTPAVTPQAVTPQQNGDLKYVSEPKLKELGVYPLQLKTVLLFRNAFTIGLLLLAGLLWLASGWLKRRQ
jgi:hypothetical protein